MWVLWGSPRRRSAVIGMTLLWALLIASLMPWAARNHHLTGRWTWLTNRLGISLYDGLGPQATGASDLGEIKNSPTVRGLDEVGWNDYFLRESWTALTADPGRCLKLATIKLGRTWRPWPAAAGHSQPVQRIIGGIWTVAILLLALWGLWALPVSWHTLCGLLFPVIVLTALHMVFVGSVRYRLPAMPLIEILAAGGLVHLTGMLTTRRSSAVPQDET